MSKAARKQPAPEVAFRTCIRFEIACGVEIRDHRTTI
jgi:hypothetical protein